MFSDEAILGHASSIRALLSLPNLSAKGALIAAAHEKCTVISAEHVRIDSTEII